MVGRRFGLLLVLSRASKQARAGFHWLCRCDCGESCIKHGQDLRSGKTNSCSCLKVSSRMLEYGAASQNAKYGEYRRRAAEKDREFSISFEEFLQMALSNCFYCGDPPSNERVSQGGNSGSFIYNGIDRVDNSCGYTKENTVPCCKHCNLSKRDRTHDEFLNWVSKVYFHVELGG